MIKQVDTEFKDKHGNPVYLHSTVRQWIVDTVEPLGGFWWYAQVKLDSVGDFRLYQDGIQYQSDDEALFLGGCHWDFEVVTDYYSIHFDYKLKRTVVRRHYWDGHRFDFEMAELNNVYLDKATAETVCEYY
jgi:hypothetical protein